LAENAIKPDQAVWHVSTADNMPYKFWRWQLLVLEHLSGDLSLFISAAIMSRSMLSHCWLHYVAR